MESPVTERYTREGAVSLMVHFSFELYWYD